MTKPPHRLEYARPALAGLLALPIMAICGTGGAVVILAMTFWHWKFDERTVAYCYAASLPLVLFGTMIAITGLERGSTRGRLSIIALSLGILYGLGAIVQIAIKSSR